MTDYFNGKSRSTLLLRVEIGLITENQVMTLLSLKDTISKMMRVIWQLLPMKQFIQQNINQDLIEKI